MLNTGPDLDNLTFKLKTFKTIAFLFMVPGTMSINHVYMYWLNGTNLTHIVCGFVRPSWHPSALRTKA